MEIITKNITLDIYGFSGTAINRDYAGTAFKLMDKMWKVVKSNDLKHKGLNIWVYGQNKEIFAGVEFVDNPEQEYGLEHKIITIEKYAYYKHVGHYNLIKETGQSMRNELKEMGYEPIFPYVEIYGHWTNDETKLETELFICLK